MRNRFKLRVYEAGLKGLALCAVLLCAPLAQAQDVLEQARKALAAKDRKALASARDAAVNQQHPLASWIAYWEIGQRLSEATQADLDAFYAQWPGTYVEDRLRNDWLLELGRRRDWKNLATDFPRFRMNDDREVTCYALLTEHLAGRNVKVAARSNWLAQREMDDGCNLLATTLFEAKQLTTADVWLKLRLTMENNRPRAARQAAALLGKPIELAVADMQDSLARYLARKASTTGRTHAELTTLALIRQASAEPETAAELMRTRFEAKLPAELNAWVWAQVGKQAAFKLLPEAAGYYERALAAQATQRNKEPEWSGDTLAWLVRSALRADQGASRWPLVMRGITMMGEKDAGDSTWVYWRARALMATADAGEHGEPQRNLARGLLQGIASPLHFYGRLASEDLGLAQPLPPSPLALSAAERAAAAAHPGLNRSLLLINQGLRSEGVREWNFSLRGMGDRELLAAAQLACDREVWDRCINTSERTRDAIDLAQRFPTPFRNEVLSKAREIGLDPAYVYGLIRQESRFVMDAQSHVGASGLMQVMPSTARWVAKKTGLDYKPEALSDRDFNLKLGTRYLKLVLDDFGGSMAMAAAAYNAGPSRPRRWREGSLQDAAVWAENIPFNETRDYVKKVLTNATLYAQLLGGQPTSLRSRLGRQIGPRETTAAAPADLP
ncbi:lytic transglycosylase domain-containing protein [Roseateles toxinivorans]|uniref:Soluble lytic murein transglycosylase n=1 Tax=Roseateles toxinivorans TaxID=270368 RepID=A0A4R6QHH1_9BURK|nr:lytic transglycosylase domain-containing protein [Roseateles toxinivorans]TDP62211.1 soluble lytic murein transglycosylase [Roseateles toxinivorans]